MDRDERKAPAGVAQVVIVGAITAPPSRVAPPPEALAAIRLHAGTVGEVAATSAWPRMPTHTPVPEDLAEPIQRFLAIAYDAIDGDPAARAKIFQSTETIDDKATRRAKARDIADQMVRDLAECDGNPAALNINPLVMLDWRFAEMTPEDIVTIYREHPQWGGARLIAELSLRCGAFGRRVRPGETWDEARDTAAGTFCRATSRSSS